jgi:hypothetical protein
MMLKQREKNNEKLNDNKRQQQRTISQWNTLIKKQSHAPELGEQPHVRALQPKRGLQQRHHFIKVSAVLVEVDQLVKLIGMHDNVQPADLGKAILLGLNTGIADLQ